MTASREAPSETANPERSGDAKPPISQEIAGLPKIEAHRADVFYNLDVTGWPGDFVRTLPGCVKRVIGWHALPFQNVSFSGYDLIVCNFPSTLAGLKAQGYRTDYFFPAYDPELAPFALRQDRPLDVLFVGGYSRHHKQRAAVLEAVANMAYEYNVVFHLDRSRLCRLAESPLGRLLPLAKHRRRNLLARHGNRSIRNFPACIRCPQ